MPPRIKITDEQILNTAVEIVRKQGIGSLNARSLAAELGCSVQPIFRVYAYIRFAREEKFLFQYLHMSGSIQVKETADFTTRGVNKEIADAIAQMTGLTAEQAQFLYAGIFFTAHGMASMIATNTAEFTDEEIRRIITTMFWGTAERLKKARKYFSCCIK